MAERGATFQSVAVQGEEAHAKNRGSIATVMMPLPMGLMQHEQGSCAHRLIVPVAMPSMRSQRAG